MRWLTYGLLLGGMLVGTASASSVQFYFSTQGYGGSVPPEYTQGTAPTIESGETVYLWGRTIYADIWNGIGIQFGSGSATFDVVGGEMYNPMTKAFWMRWEEGSDLDPVPDDLVTMVSITSRGLGHYEDVGFGEYEGSDFILHTLVGEINFVAFDPAQQNVPVYLESSGLGITRQGGTTQEDVYFGFGDAAIKNNSPKGTRTALPDLFVHSDIPEPSGILLLALVGFVLRRR